MELDRNSEKGSAPRPAVWGLAFLFGASLLLASCQDRSAGEAATLEGDWVFHKWEIRNTPAGVLSGAKVTLKAGGVMIYTSVPRPDGFGSFSPLTGTGSWSVADSNRVANLKLFHEDQKYIQPVEVYGSGKNFMRFVIDVDTSEGLVLHRKK